MPNRCATYFTIQGPDVVLDSIQQGDYADDGKFTLEILAIEGTYGGYRQTSVDHVRRSEMLYYQIAYAYFPPDEWFAKLVDNYPEISIWMDWQEEFTGRSFKVTESEMFDQYPNIIRIWKGQIDNFQSLKENSHE